MREEATQTARLRDVVAGLRRFSTLDQPESGRREEQAYIDTPRGRLFTTLVQPGRRRHDVGFLVCHSFAYEQFELYPLELGFARAAATAGFPAVSFQARGYGDSGGPFLSATPTTHVEDAVAAAAYLRERTGVGAVLPVGPRFGAAVACMVAGEAGCPGVALWGPALHPGRYVEGLLKAMARSHVMAEAHGTDAAGGGLKTAELKRMLESGDVVELFGYPVSPEFYRQAQAMRPVESVGRLERALVLVINPRDRREAQEAAGSLRARGVEADLQEADGPGKGQFGVGLPVGGHLATNLALFQDVARRTIAWAEASS